MKSWDLLHAIDGVDDALLQDAVAPVKAKRTLPRAAKMGLIAACLCIALVGTVFAVELLMGDVRIDYMEDTIPPQSTLNVPQDGFAPVLEVLPLEEEDQQEVPEGSRVMPEISTRGVMYQPIDHYSPELVEMAAEVEGYQFFYEGFRSWSEMEEYLGFDILNNPVLDAAQPWHTFKDAGDAHCQLMWLANEGQLRAAHADATYLTNYQPYYENGVQVGEVPVYVFVDARTYTEFSPIAREEMFGAYYFPDGTQFVEEPYEAADGKIYNIVGVYVPASQIWEYYAFLPMNGAAVALHTSCAFSENALQTLQQILDAFE